jgi:histidinol-phosphate aminotransferase
VLSTPTFDGYPIFAQMARLTPVTIPLDQYGYQDLVTMAEAAVGAKVVVLCRPHNPTGTLEAIPSVDWFLNQIPTHTVVLLDEAYIEFVASRYRIDGPELIRRFPNIVVLRTFSKAYGLAGLRIGYGFAAPELAAKLYTMQLPFGMSNVSVAAVAASYDAETQLAHRIRRIVAERNHLRLRLMAMGVYSMDSHANFVYLPKSRRPWREVFAEGGPQVRCYPDGGARITVGELPSTLAVLSAVEKSLA